MLGACTRPTPLELPVMLLMRPSGGTLNKLWLHIVTLIVIGTLHISGAKK